MHVYAVKDEESSWEILWYHKKNPHKKKSSDIIKLRDFFIWREINELFLLCLKNA